MPSAGIRHSIVNVCACASPSIAVTTYSGTAMLRACSHSCSRVFGSLPSVAGIEVGELRRVDALDHRARRVEAGVDEDGAEDRLQRIGEDRRPFVAAAPHLALAEQDLAAQPEAAREPRERVAIDEARADARQLAFGNRRETARTARRRRRSSARRRRRTPAARCASRRGCGGSAPAAGARAGETRGRGGRQKRGTASSRRSRYRRRSRWTTGDHAAGDVATASPRPRTRGTG